MHFGNVKLPILAAFFAFWSVGVQAQTTEIVDEILDQISEQLTDEEELDIATAYDDLLYYYQNPIDLNTATKEQLEKLIFLSDIDIENLLFYQYQYGEIYTTHELALVEGLDETTVRFLQHFVCVRAKDEQQKYTFKDVFKYGRHEILVRNDYTIEQKSGFRRSKTELAEHPEKYYLGDPFYASLKYRFRFKDKVQFGFSAEKDAGEQFVGAYNKGYDSYNGFLQIDDLWRFKTIVVGDYRAVFGQGLVLRSEFAMPDASVLHIAPRNSGLRKSSSTDEFYFMRGAGATLDVKNFRFTAFYSYRQMDADTVGGTFSTLQTNGLHRKLSELEKKRTLATQIVGGNVSYNGRKFHVGITSSTVIYGLAKQPNGELYTQMQSRGRVQSALGVDYRFRLHKFNFFGETAVSSNRGVATINSLFFAPTSRIGVLFSHRYYSPRYDQLFANGFGAKGTNNENGFYLGVEIFPVKKWKFSASANAYRRPWASYQTDKSATFYRILGRIEFKPKSNFSLVAQINFREDEKNFSQPTTTQQITFVRNLKHTYTLYYNLLGINFKTRIGANHAREATQKTTHGFMILQNISYKIPVVGVELDGGYCYFDAEDYNNRFSVYESDVPFVFSIPMLYGKGCRYYLNAGYNVLRNFSIWVKFAQTYYTDNRVEIGSGWDKINGHRKSDIRVQMRFRF